jgi:spermidine/putrescine transport system permease protein
MDGTEMAQAQAADGARLGVEGETKVERRGRSLSPEARSYWLIAPALAFVLLFMIIPFGGLVAVSFAGYDGLNVVWQFTLDNYHRVLTEKPVIAKSIGIFGLAFPAETPVYLALIAKSILVSLAVTIAVILIGYPVAIYLSRLPDHKKSLYLFIITLPFWTSYLLRIFAWKFILGQSGLINGTLVKSGVIAAPLEFLLYSPAAVTITLIHTWVTLAIIPIFLSVDKIDRSLYDAAADLGDNAWRMFRRVTLPLSLPGVRSAALLVFIPAVGDFVGPSLVGGTSGSLVGNAVLSFFKAGDYPPMGSALVMTTLCAVAIVTLFLNALLRRGAAGRG